MGNCVRRYRRKSHSFMRSSKKRKSKTRSYRRSLKSKSPSYSKRHHHHHRSQSDRHHEHHHRQHCCRSTSSSRQNRRQSSGKSRSSKKLIVNPRTEEPEDYDLKHHNRSGKEILEQSRDSIKAKIESKLKTKIDNQSASKVYQSYHPVDDKIHPKSFRVPRSKSTSGLDHLAGRYSMRSGLMSNLEQIPVLSSHPVSDIQSILSERPSCSGSFSKSSHTIAKIERSKSIRMSGSPSSSPKQRSKSSPPPPQSSSLSPAKFRLIRESNLQKIASIRKSILKSDIKSYSNKYPMQLKSK
ncbi:ras-related protein Rab-18-like [Sarcoptes scabiei]|nr:ras-related protein Rab-18-like [Sarcoptes scabiei]